ncbi:cbb3-type cytochrome oxidase subunit 3 [Chryseobacterium sp. MFBS3-17]|uniref:cbb3-type cytochrome oxidase subunit 3 n=1 Tax=Chryseobacterium sp. MFBS3-17 TaxID=2886689 RepID=UPI001D0E5ECA|nr:cbb3-type cytochrome c oxidase subunit 3 [Chryseobacterium sp. MFBS3-17]MCC2589377.1 cbb3-type cytochrome c oxidase subunit 3 [Chryseobacterium sp. MFBS3-17]
MANGDYASLLQIFSLLALLIFFLGLIFYVFSRPKKYYRDEERAPLDDDQPFNSNN